MEGLVLRPAGHDSITSLPTSGSYNSIPNVDGSVRILNAVPAKARSKITTLFSKKTEKPDDDSEDSPTEASEFYALKRKRSEKAAVADAKNKDAEASGTKSASSSHSRLAARLLRSRGRPGNLETGLSLDDAEHHPFDAARQRLNDQRERKMRRKATKMSGFGQKNQETQQTQQSQGQQSQVQRIPELQQAQRAQEVRRAEHDQHSEHAEEKKTQEVSVGDRHHHHLFNMAESVKKSVHFTRPKDQFDAFMASKGTDKAEMGFGGEDGSRLGNAMRRVGTHLMSTATTEETEAGVRRASWASGTTPPSSRRGSTAQEMRSSSSGSPDEEFYVPRAADLPAVIPPVPLIAHQTYQAPLIQTDDQPMNTTMHGALSNSSYIFPPKPPAPFFRPTLSPVSSRSPAPTTVHPATVSPKLSLHGKGRSRPASVSPMVQSVEQTASPSSLYLPLSEVAPPPEPTPPRLTIKNGPPSNSTHASADSSRESVALSPIMEQPTPEQGNSRRSSRNSEERSQLGRAEPPRTAISPPGGVFCRPSAETPTKPISVVSGATQMRPKDETNRSLNDTPLPFSEIHRPRDPPPHPPPSPLKVAPRTPTSSALEFWREADESLAPSESASAVPPNPRAEPPPNFWKAADRNLDTGKEKGPTMEEWIATLPGLGLGLGMWGNNDGALDWKYFQSLKASRELRPCASSVKSVAMAQSAQEMIEENIGKLQKVIEHIEETNSSPKKSVLDTDGEGLTPDEAEAIDDISAEPESPIDNLAPVNINPDLLHPGYSRSPAPRRPQSRLGQDVADKLVAMEKYWADQSVPIGAVLRRMLVVVDNLIVKEREQAQKEARKKGMGWQVEIGDTDGTVDARTPVGSTSQLQLVSGVA